MHSILAFCRLLRRLGVPVTTADVIDALRALEHLDLGDEREVYLGLRAVFISRPDDIAIFDRAFDLFWRRAGSRIVVVDERQSGASLESEPLHKRRPRPVADLSVDGFAKDDAETGGDLVDAPGMSDRESLAGQDFATFREDALDELLRAAMALARRLAGDARRRWRPSRRGRLDFRRTVRANLARDEWIHLARKRRRQRPQRLLILCDVSGSMNLYSRVLLLFIYALQQAFARVETFTFATRLTRITGYLKSPSYREALNRLAVVNDWAGGTRIGESLAGFNRQWSRLVDRHTIVIILSDGWDTGAPELLASELRSLRRRARRVVWLNPLLGHPNYQPLTRGMAAALPLVDRFAPAHNLRSLQDLARSL